MVKKKIFITTGGTGGHIIPAIALYAELKKGDILLILSQTKEEKIFKFLFKNKSQDN